MTALAKANHGQQGQALVLGMLLLSVAVLAFLRYFAVGQVVAAKSRQTHALDAAAYSGALIQARALNTLAYINRAHAGHQVAMAHLVTLGSWASLGGTEARQLASGNPPAHLIGMLFGPAHGAAYMAASKASGFDTLSQAQGELGQAYARHDSDVRNVLIRSQNDIVASLPDARQEAIAAVLAANYPDLGEESGFELTVDHDNWQGFLRHYPGQQYLLPYVMNVSRLYDFLAPRNHTSSNNWVVDARCPGLRHQLRRRGATELDTTGRWQSADTQSFHALRSNRWIGCYYREYAMGWGWIPSANAPAFDDPYVDNPPDNFSAQDFWRWVKDATDWDIAAGTDNPLANSRAVASRNRWQGGGVPGHIDVSDGRGTESLRFGLSLQHPGPEGVLVTTRSAAETFFDRPDRRADKRHERAHLFHPYWQARLAIHDFNKGRP